MKVLLLGATGNVGLRLVPALLTQGHQVVAYVRSSSKLESLLSSDVFNRITVVEGNATDSTAVKNAILNNNCNAVVSAAGAAALPPWGKSDINVIFRGIFDGAKAASAERGSPLRIWFMGGLGVLNYPGTQTMLSSYVPIYLEHRQNLALLKAQAAHSLEWSLFCPSNLIEESSDFSVPTKASSAPKLIANAGSPPNWMHSWLEHVPFLGRIIVAGMNAGRYEISLEQVANFIAEDLASDNTRWINTPIGAIDPSK